jgi:hypothetical protein
MYEVVRGFADVFFRISGDQGRSILLDLLEHEEVELTASLLRSQIFHYGLFGHSPHTRPIVLSHADETEQIARATALKHRDQHLNGRFLWALWDFNPVYTMVDTKIWDDACRNRLNEFLADPRAVDAVTLMFYGAHYTTGRDFISKFTDLDQYLALVDQRLATSDLHESVRLALEKAKDPVFG